MVACLDKPGVKYKILVSSTAPPSHARNERAQASDPCSARMQRIRGGVLQNEANESSGVSSSVRMETHSQHSSDHTITVTEAALHEFNLSRVRSPRAEVDAGKPRASRMAQSESSREFLGVGASPMHQRRKATLTSDAAQSARLDYTSKTMKARSPSLSVESEIKKAKEAVLATDRRLQALRTTSGADSSDSLSRRKNSSIAAEIAEARLRLADNCNARTGSVALLAQLSEVQNAVPSTGERRSSAMAIASIGGATTKTITGGSASPRTSFVGRAGVSLSWSPS